MKEKTKLRVSLAAMLILATLFMNGVGADDVLLRLGLLEEKAQNHEDRLQAIETKLQITPPDKCDGITCEDSTTTCWDGYETTCANTCTAGTCSQCIPSCEGHTNPCEGITCNNNTLTCPDSYVNRCQNTCQQNNGQCTSCTPSCVGHENAKPVVIIQMDDCQAWWREKECVDLVNIHIQKGVPVTLGIVPEELLQKEGVGGSLTENLKLWNKNNRNLVEPAVHTFDHSTNYAGWSVSRTAEDIRKGKAVFDQLGIPTTSFIPAYDWGGVNVPPAIVSAGLKVGIDASDNPYADSTDQPMILENGEFYGYGYTFYSFSYSTVSAMIDNNLKATGKDYFILGYHHNDITTSSRKTALSSLLGQLKSSGKYRLMTAEQYYAYKNGGT